MSNQLIEYIKLHKLSLEQDQEELHNEMDVWPDLNSDEYKDLEILDISLNGQIMALGHIIEYAEEIQKGK